MESDGNATSWLPVDEYFDNLDINEFVLADVKEDGWVVRIDGEVDKAKEVVEKVMRQFVSEVQRIRNLSGNEFVNKVVQQAYYNIDQPFRHWLSTLEVNQDKDGRIQEWRLQLREIIRKQADGLVKSASHRDYKGVFEQDKPFSNIATAYNRFDYWLNRCLGFIKS